MSGKDDIILTVEVEVNARKVVRKEEGQPSTVNGHSTEERKQPSSGIQPTTASCCLNSSLKDKFLSLGRATGGSNQENNANPRIQKVPSMLLENMNFTKYYEPIFVAFGPIHRGNCQLEGAEKVKIRLAGHFIEDYSLEKEALWDKIMSEIENLKEFYEEGVIKEKDYKDEHLAWMFLVDGCAMLQFILCFCETQDKLMDLNIKSDQVAFIQRDMFLLENQLPYKVLELLMLSNSEDRRVAIQRSVIEFIRESSMTPPLAEGPRPDEVFGGQPCHLLGLLRENILDNHNSQKDKAIENQNEKKQTSRAVLLENFMKPFQVKKKRRIRPSFRHIQELIESGVTLKSSATHSLKDISFEQNFWTFWRPGILRLPPFRLDDSTATALFNLTALEMCPTFMNNLEVSSYVCFLDSLIDQAADVQELRRRHSLHSCLGSDEYVAKLFNEVRTHFVPNPDVYDAVTREMEKYYTSIWTTRVIPFFFREFYGFWTILAFLAAVLGLVLTFIQTWHSVHPKRPCNKSARILSGVWFVSWNSLIHFHLFIVACVYHK